MPRKKSDENLTKVISSIISAEDFESLEKYAKVYYNMDVLKLPTISHMVRYILSNWVKHMRNVEQLKRGRNARNNLATPRNENLEMEILDRLTKKR